MVSDQIVRRALLAPIRFHGVPAYNVTAKSNDFYVTTPQLPQSGYTVARISGFELAVKLR